MKTIRKLIFIIMMLLAYFAAKAQDFEKKEAELATQYETMRKCSNDEDRKVANDKFKKKLKSFLKTKKSNKYIIHIKGLSRLVAKDNRVFVYSWNLQNDDGSFTYYGFVHFREKWRKYKVIELIDNSAMISNPETQILKAKNWYGALYYDIVYTKYKRKRTYTLLGWDGNDYFTTKKIIDVLTIEKNKPVFGSIILQNDKKMQSRIIIEYAEAVKATLRYDKEYKMIVWDHLSPSKKELKGQFQYYGPDFTYDGLFFNKGKWDFYSDVKVKNGSEDKSDKKHKFGF